ncbi:MAG: ABC transporter substrate-binding protein [Thermoproteota archaeon]
MSTRSVRGMLPLLVIAAMLATSLAWAVPQAAAQENYYKLKFEVLVPEYDPVRIRAAELLAQYAAQVGIKIEVRPVDLNYEITKTQDEHDFDMYIIGWTSKNMPMYISSFIKIEEDRPGGNNIEGIRNETLDTLAKQLDRTVDPEKQKEILWRIQEILADQVPYVGIYTRYLTQVWVKNLKGLHKEYWGYASPMTWRTAYLEGQEGGTLTVILADDLRTENVLLERSIYEDMVWDALYDTLVYLDDNYSPKPWVAYKYEWSPDGKVWTFYLVRNATWHDGKPLTADDVVFTFNYIVENNIPGFDIAKYIERAEKVDDYTVRLYLKQPYAWLLYDLADTPILPKHVWENVQWNASKVPLIGSGPYKWSKRVEGEYIELVKFDKYWRPDMPKMDRLVFRVIKNFNTALLAMEAGEAHFYVYYIPPSAVERVKQNPNLHLNLERGITFYYLGFNLRRPPLDDVWLRRAIAYLIPKKEVVEGPLQGLGEPCTWYISPYFGELSNPNVPKKYPWIGSIEPNIEKAREMLAKSDKYEYKDVDGDGILEAIPKKPGASPTTTKPPAATSPATTTSVTKTTATAPASPTETATTPAASPTTTPARTSLVTVAAILVVIVVIAAALAALRRR